MLTVQIGGAGGQSLYEHRGRCAEEDDVVEPRVELPLVRLAATDEEHFRVGSRQESVNAIFAPNPIQLTGIDYPFGPFVRVRIDGLVAARGQLSNQRRLAHAGHAGKQYPFHSGSLSWSGCFRC